ncbi:hypothetical protein D3C87_1992920 [compost metagenome]
MAERPPSTTTTIGKSLGDIDVKSGSAPSPGGVELEVIPDTGSILYVVPDAAIC